MKITPKNDRSENDLNESVDPAETSSLTVSSPLKQQQHQQMITPINNSMQKMDIQITKLKSYYEKVQFLKDYIYIQLILQDRQIYRDKISHLKYNTDEYKTDVEESITLLTEERKQLVDMMYI